MSIRATYASLRFVPLINDLHRMPITVQLIMRPPSTSLQWHCPLSEAMCIRVTVWRSLAKEKTASLEDISAFIRYTELHTESIPDFNVVTARTIELLMLTVGEA